MKRLFIILALLRFAQLSIAQGTISSLTVSPPNPTVNDDIEIHALVQFTSGDCQLDNQGHNINGNSIEAYSHHCVGLLTVICPTTDTFQIGQLPAGDYSFNFTLTSGFGGAGCSPGIVPDDSDQIQFTVSPSVGIDEITWDQNFAYPNPVTDILFLSEKLEESAVIADINGRTVFEISEGSAQISVEQLSPGVYFLRTKSKRFRFVKD